MKSRALNCLLAVIALIAAPAHAGSRESASVSGEAARELPSLNDAEMLSAFGGRANFSPDGKRIAFVGKTYGDAYELDIATGKLRNLTRGFPHQGIMRIQYLPDGNFLVTAPRVQFGPNTRAHLEMWFLDKDLQTGLQPLGESVFEGIAISRKSNLIAWTAVDPTLRPGDNWQMAFIRPTTRHIAEIAVVNGKPALVSKRSIMVKLPKECTFIEPQDFRANDSELVYSCMGMTSNGGILISVMGNQIAQDRNVTYYRKEGEYNEVEGMAPNGSWTTVECGKQDTAGLPELDICRLDLRRDGKLERIVRGRAPDSTSDVSNPIVSPDGKWLVFQRSDSASPDIGEGYGLYRIRLTE
ncbi:MAG: hypothetical protein P8J20_10400 [Novosphingobium sp.]|nr:hypothetical protein [Novosphingobium sp.]